MKPGGASLGCLTQGETDLQSPPTSLFGTRPPLGGIDYTGSEIHQIPRARSGSARLLLLLVAHSTVEGPWTTTTPGYHY